MSVVFETFVAGVPKPQGSLKLIRDPRTGKEVASYAGPTIEWRNTLYRALSLWWGDHEPLRAPVQVGLEFVVPRPAVHYSAKGGLKASATTYPTGKTGDLDKLIRAVLDSCTDAQVWGDDGQVSRISATKYYVPVDGRTGVRITVEEIP